MFDKEAVEALKKAEDVAQVRDSLVQAFTMEHGLLAAPNDFNLHDIEYAMDTRRRARGVMDTASVEAFAAYTKDHAEEGATVFIDMDKVSAVAVLNLGTSKKPGQADNLAKLSPKMTAAYQALLRMSGEKWSQKSVAEFFEDWVGNISFYDDNGIVPASKAIAAVRRITIESMRKQETEDKQLSASKSTFENVQATSKDPIPTFIYFKCKPFKDLAEREFVLRLSVLTGSDLPSLTLRIVKQEEHQEEMAQELASLVTVAMYGSMTPIPVTLGSYTKTK